MFNPQSYFMQGGAGSFSHNKYGFKFTFTSGKSLTFTYAKGSKLPIAHGLVTTSSQAQVGFLSLITSRTLNLFKAQEKLLLWYSILGCFGVRNTQLLIRGGCIHKRILGAGTCNIPMCRTCVTGKGEQFSIQTAKNIPNPEHTNIIKRGDLQPDDYVSTDQFECRVK